MLRLIDICQEPITRSLQLVTEVPVGISIRDKFKTKNRSVCENAVTMEYGLLQAPGDRLLTLYFFIPKIDDSQCYFITRGETRIF